MAISDEGGSNGFYMPVAPAYGGNGGFGGFGGDGWWIILLLLCGWGGMGMGGMGGMMWPMMMMNGGMGGFGLYPWLDNSQHISDGFRDQMLGTQVTSIGDKVTSGFGDVATQLCGGFAGVTAAVNGAQNALAQQLYTNQIADLERSFAAQTANTAGLNAIQAQQAQCCCENRAGIADLKYTIASEACNDRAAIQNGIQTILDKLCQQEIDNLKAANSNLQTQVLMRDLAASQNAQTAALVADNTAQTQYIVNRVAPYPIPAYTVANPATGCCNSGCNGGFIG